MAKRIIKDYKAETQHIIDWIKDYFCQNAGPDTKAVIGISGGKDSTIVAYLCAAALGKERVVGVKMPCGEQHDIDCADAVIHNLGIDDFEINIDVLNQAFQSEMKIALDTNELPTGVTYNAPPRLRMMVVYGIAAAIGGRVANTSNYSERYIGWSTKWGDGTGDFAPLANYTVEEVLNIGKELGIPDDLLYKTPEDGLTGTSDEQAIGVEYAIIDNFIRGTELPDYNACRTIRERHKINQHKIQAQHLPAPYPRLDWDNGDGQACHWEESCGEF